MAATLLRSTIFFCLNIAKIIERPDELLVFDIDKDIKNKFKWEWLEKSIEVTLAGRSTKRQLGECIRKVNEPGKVLCIFQIRRQRSLCNC